MKTRRVTSEYELACSPLEALRRLKTSNLIIHTIPGEEWTLSVARHPVLLVDIYTLIGTIAGTKKVQTYRCGRLCEILIRLLRYGRKVQYHSHTPKPEEENVLAMTLYNRSMVSETLEENAMRRLRGGDIIFNIIPGESWRLTNTWFGTSLAAEPATMFHFAEESTLGTPNPWMFKGLDLEHTLLAFLLQHADFVERQTQPRIVELASVKSLWREE